MCTVTYIPTGSGDDFVFTSNRDEAPHRKAMGLISEERYEQRLLYPQDAGAQGSWIILSDRDRLVCVLNGAFVSHRRRPPYRLSRGVMAREFFSYTDAETFFEEYDFVGIEPFTMAIYDAGALYELRWDTERTHITRLAADERHLWASATLYNDELQQKRRDWFAEWERTHDEVTIDSVLDYHRHGGEGNPESDVVMNYKGIVCTTSITSISHAGGRMHLRYEDLLDGAVQHADLPLSVTIDE